MPLWGMSHTLEHLHVSEVAIVPYPLVSLSAISLNQLLHLFRPLTPDAATHSVIPGTQLSYE
jgi:hypothetical protein